MIKNPVNPDLKLWMGAFERFYNTGKRKLIAIHRGFYFFNKSEYRNAPMWEIPIELKRQFPSLPIITDPATFAETGYDLCRFTKSHGPRNGRSDD